jgi:NADH:ubiquinone oxidoreductase subunit 5 (subunit L)/multisubunit Na+/H+ antiporter MnhA subunit
MDTNLLMFVAVFAPIAGCFFLPAFAAVSERARNAFAVLLGAAMVAGVLGLIPSVWGGALPYMEMRLPLGLGLAFSGDPLAVFMATVSAVVGMVIIVYSLGYISHYANQTEYYMMVLLFLGSMMGLVFSMNMIWMYVFWEITAICSWRLVGFFRKEADVLRADKTFLVTVFGALCMLLGFVAVYADYGTFNLVALRGKPISDLAMALILLGILSKSATLPFSTWLPDAGVAPSPVTALLHAAVLVKIGVYAYARFFCATFQYAPAWGPLIMTVAAASAIVAAGAALIETDLKRIIAYSTISQIGFIFLGLAAGNPIGFAGAMLYILMHGVAKGGLFLCAGIVEHGAHTKDITKLGGLFRRMPVTGLAFAFCALSVMGIPPFGGFFSKFMGFQGAAAAQEPWITAAFLFGALLTILYLFRVFYAVFLGEDRHPQAHEGSPSMVWSVATLGALSLALGVAVYYPARFAGLVLNQINAGIR